MLVLFNGYIVDYDVAVTYFLSYRVMGGLCPGHVQPGSFLLLYLDGDRVPPVLLGIQKEKKAALWVRGHRATGRSDKLSFVRYDSMVREYHSTIESV